MTPTEWDTWAALDDGTDGVVRDPAFVDEMPAYLQGSKDFESWEVFNCESIDANGFTCDMWLRVQTSTRNGYPRFSGDFDGHAALVDNDATDNSLKR